MDFSLASPLAVLIASIVGFAVGGIWFGPKTFYPIWRKAMGDPVPVAEIAPGPMFGLTYLSVLLQAIVLATLMVLLDRNTLGGGACIGSIVGIAFAAGPSLSHRLFSGQGVKVWAIEVAADILQLTLMGATIGLLQ